MAIPEQVSLIVQGVDVWNAWRESVTDEHLDLSGARLQGGDLFGAELSRTDLSDADLSWCNLKRAELSDAALMLANLQEAILSDAYLFRSNMIGANLSGANLHRAKLWYANFQDTKLYGARFSKARAHGTIFGDIDLSGVKALDKVVHASPSIISTGTFARSKGKIPDVFLRGCGLTDWEIEEVKLYNPDLSNDEINTILYRMYDLRASQSLQLSPLFISYSHGDDAFVDKIGRQLTEKGVRYWRDIHGMKAGRIEKQIDRAIRQNPTVLLVLSEHSLRSDWVEHEVRTARELEKELDRDVLCPVALDDSWKDSRWPKRLMEQVMEYNILDFSAWEDESTFEGTFNKLVDGLKIFNGD